jgi:hypothetical protein
MSRPAVSRGTAAITPVAEIEGAIGHYRVTPGAIRRPMSEDCHHAHRQERQGGRGGVTEKGRP